MLKFELPPAPSLNNATINVWGHGRVKSPRYRRWLARADAHYVLQNLGRIPKIKVPYACFMRFPKAKGADIDGRAKLILDWMVSRNLTIDDRYCRRLALEIDETIRDNLVRIEVTADVGSQLPSEPGATQRAA